MTLHLEKLGKLPKLSSSITAKRRRRHPGVEEIDRTPIRTSVADLVPLTGFIQGLPAKSEAEERLARGFDRAGRDYIYEFEVWLPGDLEPHHIDFLVDPLISPTPTEVKGGIGHDKPEDKMNDEIRETDLADQIFRDYGITNEFVSIDADLLTNQDAADRIARTQL